MAKLKKAKKVAEVKEAKPKEAKKVDKGKEFPVGVQIISIFAYIVSTLLIFMGILFIIYGTSFSDVLIEVLGEYGPGIVVVLGALFLGSGILGIFVGIGLWRRKSWARITAIVLMTFIIFSSLYGLFAGGGIVRNIITILISGVIGAYLTFSKEAKEAFK